jgi:hypothetical protein
MHNNMASTALLLTWSKVGSQPLPWACVHVPVAVCSTSRPQRQHASAAATFVGILETWRKSKTHAALKALSKQWEDSDGAIVCHFFVELGIGPGHVFLNPADFMVATLTGRNVVPPNHLLLRLEVIGDLYVSSPADWELDSRSVLSKSGWKALQLVETELLKRADDEFKTHTVSLLVHVSYSQQYVCPGSLLTMLLLQSCRMSTGLCYKAASWMGGTL